MFTLDDLKEYLEQRDAADTTFFINPSFLSAIVENPDWTEEDAIEWIDFNTLRTVPYMGNKAPIIVFPLPL